MTPTVHRNDLNRLTTYCGRPMPYPQFSTADPAGVTCRACQRVAERRVRQAQRRRAGLPPAGDLRPTGVEPE